MHWGQRNKWKKAIDTLLYAHGDLLVKLEPKIDLRITRFYGYRKRAFDKDNLYGACKPLIDAVRGLQVIPDDTPAHINLYVEQEKSPTKQSFVRISAHEVDIAL
jgi:hypothetical protein